MMLLVGGKHSSPPLERFYFHPGPLGNMRCFQTHRPFSLGCVFSFLRKGSVGEEEAVCSAVHLSLPCVMLCIAMIPWVMCQLNRLMVRTCYIRNLIIVVVNTPWQLRGSQSSRMLSFCKEALDTIREKLSKGRVETKFLSQS